MFHAGQSHIDRREIEVPTNNHVGIDLKVSSIFAAEMPAVVFISTPEQDGRYGSGAI